MDSEQPAAGYHLTLPDFEGPLDLLLHLVKRHELDIFDIPIAFVTEKYLEYLDLMKALNLDVAGEYLLMAAHLAEIKSRMLLPRPELEAEEEDDDGADPRLELIRRLLEYQKYRDASEQLLDRPLLGRQVFRRGAPSERLDASEVPLVEVGTFALVEALAELARRTEVQLTHDVMVDRISISDRINEIVDRLQQQETARFSDCFTIGGDGAAQTRHDLVVTFLAILEMTRLMMVRIYQRTPGDAADIYITRTADLHSVDEVEEYGNSA